MENIEQLSALRITPTVRALSSALRGKRENVPEGSQKNGDRILSEPEKLWFKESTAKNLRTRDFLSPSTMLNTLYADCEVSLTCKGFSFFKIKCIIRICLTITSVWLCLFESVDWLEKCSFTS